MNKKNVLITGASRGIGAALAKAFAAEGYACIGINYHSSVEGAEEVLNVCKEHGAKPVLLKADVSNSTECARMTDEFIKTCGHLDVLINNAGGALKIPAGGFNEMPTDYWDSQIHLNLNAAAYCSRLAVSHMLEAGLRGQIINISSIHGEVTWVRRKTLPYDAAKAGLNMFTKALGVEVARYGIRVNGIAPGFISTKATTRYNGDELKMFRRKIPAGMLGEVGDITPLAIFLADEEKTRFIVGQTFVVDGGQSIDGAIDGMLDTEL